MDKNSIGNKDELTQLYEAEMEREEDEKNPYGSGKPLQEEPLSAKATIRLIGGTLTLALGLGLVFLLVFFLFILFCIYVWF